MSSKDLAGISLIKDFARYEIDSLKIEGRMKSHLYVGTLSKVYSGALKDLRAGEKEFDRNLAYYQSEIRKITHRDYFSGNLNKKAGAQSIFTDREHGESEYGAVGEIIDFVGEKQMVIEVKAAFNCGDSLEVLPFEGQAMQVSTDVILDVLEESILRTKPGMLVKLPFVKGPKKSNLVRQRFVK